MNGSIPMYAEARMIAAKSYTTEHALIVRSRTAASWQRCPALPAPGVRGEAHWPSPQFLIRSCCTPLDSQSLCTVNKDLLHCTRNQAPPFVRGSPCRHLHQPWRQRLYPRSPRAHCARRPSPCLCRQHCLRVATGLASQPRLSPCPSCSAHHEGGARAGSCSQIWCGS